MYSINDLGKITSLYQRAKSEISNQLFVSDNQQTIRKET